MIITRGESEPYLPEHLIGLNEQFKTGMISIPELLSTLQGGPLEAALSLWITNDPAMKAVKDKIRKIRINERREPVLITGPTGTGKELLARALQDPNEPFVAVNCGGLPKDLVPSLFFGHSRGAFTGAVADRTGYLKAAAKGVIFLDEIAELPLELQATLLRAIQENEIYPVGSIKPEPIECRFIAATKHDLRALVDAKQFREDLFARLYTFELRITALKERPDDIPLIAKSMNWNEPIPDDVLPDIHTFNVRAIQTYIARKMTYGYY